MSDTVICIDDPDAILLALEVLHRGGIIAFPTDTVYGLAANAFDAKAISRLFEAKGRDFNRAIAVLIGDLSKLTLVTESLPPSAENLARKFWPGALTLVVKRHAELPDLLSPKPTIGIRIPDHIFAVDLLRQSGPLASTSANRSGDANPLTAQDVMDQLGGKVDLILNGGRVKGGIPSTVVDCTLPNLPILRQGAIDADVIQNALKEADGQNDSYLD